MRVLALSPYHGGSHARFLDLWMVHTRHEITPLTLPARHFPWRIRQAPVGLALAARKLHEEGATFDAIWTTAMLDVAELRGLLHPAQRSLPLVNYFHENQLAYPVQNENSRDQHLHLINWASALAADENWFNSRFNLLSLLSGLRELLRKMPDEESLFTLETINGKSHVEAPAIEVTGEPGQAPGPLHIAWVGRWEHDKRPDLFFAALDQLRAEGRDFRLTCLGQSFRTWPVDFQSARERFRDQVEHFGYEADRARYLERLRHSDVVVSTADHEFFGMALLEAVALGSIPVVPDRLVYPDLYPARCLYAGDVPSLVRHLRHLAEQKAQLGTLRALHENLGLPALVGAHRPVERARSMDARLEEVSVRLRDE